MFEMLGRFFRRTRRPITVLATTLGGGYLALSYLRSKLNEMQDSLTRTRVCTENLRRRFEQNQEDCSFTVLALIPTLGKQVIQSMNVEKLVEFLSQTKSRASKPDLSESKTENHPGPDSTHLINGDSQLLHLNNISQSLEHTHENEEEPLPDEIQVNRVPSHEKSLDGTDGSNGPIDKSQLIHTPPSHTPEDLSQILSRPDGTLIQKRSEIWTEMMLVSFTRLFTCLYGVTLLNLQTHIQLSLLGRDLYLNSIVSENFDEVGVNDDDTEDRFSNFRERDQLQVATERRYLTFSWWYLHRGWIILSKRIRDAVTDVFASRSLKDQISLSDLEEIFNSIRKTVELERDGTDFSFTPILLPPTLSDELETLKLGGMPPEDCEVDARLRSLLDETQDFIDCPDFRLVLSCSMDKIINLCTFNVGCSASLHPHSISSPAVNIPPSKRFTELERSDQVCLPSGRTARIVEILPIISKESLQLLNVVPNEYIETLSDTRELKEFSSVIYTAFDGFANKSETMTTK